MTAIGALEDPFSVLQAMGLNTCQHHHRPAFWARGAFGRDRRWGCKSESEHEALLMGRPEPLGQAARLPTAARVACIASATRSLRSFTSTSVAPPTRIEPADIRRSRTTGELRRC